ncbi:MAG TPA: dihydrodipicolinate synthase family protein [Bacteroidetes bacterium]|nr:dihydrodipicolinate synthase family protein [Bacteroidota bacterium]
MNFDVARVGGIVVPVITPFKEDESIDELALEKIVQRLLNNHVHGIFINSTTGEGVCLSDDEKKRVLEIVVNSVQSKIPVYASVSDVGSKRAIHNLQEVEAMGADIAVAHPPYYYLPNSQEEIYFYFRDLAAVSSIPMMLYNIPSTTKAPISLDTVKRLLELDTIIGIKDSSVDFVFLQNLIELKKIRPDFKVLIGKSNLWTAGILSGADGGLDGISNLIPGRCVALYNNIQNSSDSVFQQQKEINEIWRVYECRSFLGGIKGAMSLLGLCKPLTARPILSATGAEMKKIENILRKWDILK